MAAEPRKHPRRNVIMTTLGLKRDQVGVEVETFPGKWEAIVVFTVDDMIRLLATQIARNRNPRHRRINGWARDMRAGRWDPSICDFVKFTTAGALCDGQHRFLASTQAGVELETRVLLGLAMNDIYLLDDGIARNSGDALRLQGETNGRALAAIIRFYLRIQSGIDTAHIPTTPEVLGVYDHRQQDVKDAYRLARRAQHGIQVKTKPLAAMIMKAFDAGVPIADLDKFVDSLGKGVDEDGHGLDKDDPRFTLREWILRQARLADRIQRAADPIEFYVYTVDTWNACYLGRPMNRIRARRVDTLPDVLGPNTIGDQDG